MSRILLFISTLLFLICTAGGAWAQCEDLTITGQGIDITQPQVCAPVTISLSASYTLLSVADPTKVQIRVYWNDGVSDFETLDAAETSPGSRTFRISRDKEYAAGPNCAYEPETFLVYDGRLCASSRQAQKFSAWSTDDTNPGPVAIDPEEAEFCPNSAIDGFVFFDNTTFNCNIDIEPDKPNRLTRWVQFVYNTDDPNDGNLIREVTVNGRQLTDADGNFLDRFSGVIDVLPLPADGPISSSLPISAPAGSPVGSYFEITLRNWNVCNPYDDPNIAGPPADPVDGDYPPVETTARLVIVAEPQPQITAPADVCLEEAFTLAGAATGANNNYLEYRWQVYDDEEGNNLLSEGSNASFQFPGFSTAGRKLVRLRVRRTDTMDNGCWGEEEVIVRVSEAPVVEARMNGEAVDSLDFCFDDENPVRQVSYTHRLSSDNNYTYTYKLFKRNSNSVQPDSTHAELVPVNMAAGQEANASYMAEYDRPGQYKVWVVAVDNVTSCETISESITNIYDKPVPDFTSTALCEGQATLFTNTSSLPSVTGNDRITGYLWDFGDGSGTSTEENPEYTYAAGGTYEVSLVVSSQGGCTATLRKEVSVKKVPQALLDYDYTEPICPGKVNFTNLSLAANNAAFGEGVVTYTLVRTDGSTEQAFAFEGEEREFVFSNTTASNITYQVWLKAEADGCEQLSDPLTVEVLPGAQAGFFEPHYNAANINCSVFDFTFMVNEATLALGAERHHWEIYKNEEKIEEFTFLPGEDGYEVLEYTAVNNDDVSALYEVFLIPEKAGLCIQTAVNAYRIYPQPVAEDIQLEISHECEFSFVHVQVNGTGIRNFNWEIDQIPENKDEIQYDDDFVLIYKRPEIGEGALPVNISLITENFFGCSSDEMQPADGTLMIPEKVIDEVTLELVNPGDERGCSPLTVDFINTTVAPAGTAFALYVQHGANEKQQVEVNGDINSSDPFSYTFRSPGLYSVSLLAIAPDGCSLFSETSLSVEVYSDPSPYFNIENREGCGPFSISVQKNIQNSVSNRWFVTDLTDNSTVEEADMSIYLLENNSDEVKSYEIKLVSQSAGGCVADSSIVVQVYPGMEADFEIVGGDQLCQPYEVTIRNLSAGPEGTTYSWNWGDGTTEVSSEAELTHAYTNTSYQNTLYRNITLTASSPNGCEAIVSKPLELLPQVRVAVTPNVTEGCAPLQVVFRNSSEGISTHYWELREQGSTGEPLYTTTTSVPELPDLLNEGTEPKIYEVYYSGSNAAGCSGSSLTELRVFPGAEARFSMDYNTAVCAETVVSFTNLNIKPGVQYVWRWNDGEPNDTTTTETVIRHTFINTSATRIRQYEVSLTALSPDGACANTYRETVQVNPAVVVQVSPDKQEGCAPLEVNFRNQSQNVASHYWFARLAGTETREQEQTVAEASFLFENASAGSLTYEVVYVGTSADGCADSAVHHVQVYPQLQASFTTDSVRVRLPNSTFNITNETPNAAAWTHHWDFGDGSSSNAVHPGSHTYGTYGTFTITLTVSNGVCSETYSQEVSVHEILPIVDFESIPVAGCWPLEVNFVNNSQYADPNTYYWDFGDGEGFSRAVNPSYTYFKPGEYTVTLSASNPSGEVVSTSYAIVTVYERPRVDFEVRERVVYVPGDPVYVANHTRGAVSYSWDFGDGTTYNSFEPVHYYKEPGMYTITLTAQNEWGCADTLVKEEWVTAEAGGQAKIPNAFTPNSSGPNGGNIDAGNNDVFFPILEGGIRHYNMKIYNRWGELLFETSERTIGWDGYYKGSLCKADVYVYQLSVEYSDGKTHNKLGDVTLIR